jgi:uncharacterized membrane protein
MPYCSKCGASVPEAATFCQKCGQPQPASATPAQHSGLSQNTAALLSYALGWFTGLIFFLIDKRPYVRFHAAQSIITFGGLHILRAVLGMVLGVGWWFGGRHNVGRIALAWPILGLIGLASFVLWIVLMVKAYQGQKFKLLLAGNLAEDWAGR